MRIQKPNPHFDLVEILEIVLIKEHKYRYRYRVFKFFFVKSSGLRSSYEAVNLYKQIHGNFQWFSDYR